MRYTTLLRLVICSEIAVIISVKLSLYRCIQNIRTHSICRTCYKIERPILSWKIGTEIPTHLQEYNIVSQRLGYKIRWTNQTFFQCNGSEYIRGCRIYRTFVPFRRSNFEDADVKFTDYIPGLEEHVSYKANLVFRGGKYTPRGFLLPWQTTECAQYTLLPENMKKIWIQKDPSHRGNKVKHLSELNFSRESIVQEFITNPFLIDGRKFSIGVYVVFSSADPLRAYILQSDGELRFCSKAYNAHNFTDFKTYVCDGKEFGIQFVQDIDSLKDYYLKHQYSTFQSRDAYFKAVGIDPSALNHQIRDAIRDVLSTRYDLIRQNIDPRSRYFEFQRWDFILDSDLKIHLIEANIIPALGCEEIDKYYCVHVVYNLYRVMGIASFYDFHMTSIHYVIRDSDINVETDICYDSVCDICASQECRLCPRCLTVTERDNLKSVLWEHLRRGEARLVYPFATNNSIGPDNTDGDAITRRWLHLKCITDIQWCGVY